MGVTANISEQIKIIAGNENGTTGISLVSPNLNLQFPDINDLGGATGSVWIPAGDGHVTIEWQVGGGNIAIAYPIAHCKKSATQHRK